jgi:DNA topoisomerase-3
MAAAAVRIPVALEGRRARRKPSRATPRSPAERPVVLSVADHNLLESVKAWRLGEARRRRVPAFRIVTDRTLEALVRARPSDEAELLDVPGIGPSTARRFGASLLELVRNG